MQHKLKNPKLNSKYLIVMLLLITSSCEKADVHFDNDLFIELINNKISFLVSHEDSNFYRKIGVQFDSFVEGKKDKKIISKYLDTLELNVIHSSGRLGKSYNSILNRINHMKSKMLDTKYTDNLAFHNCIITVLYWLEILENVSINFTPSFNELNIGLVSSESTINQNDSFKAKLQINVNREVGFTPFAIVKTIDTESGEAIRIDTLTNLNLDEGLSLQLKYKVQNKGKYQVIGNYYIFLHKEWLSLPFSTDYIVR